LIIARFGSFLKDVVTVGVRAGDVGLEGKGEGIEVGDESTFQLPTRHFSWGELSIARYNFVITSGSVAGIYDQYSALQEVVITAALCRH
jgi:hypothetical protein